MTERCDDDITLTPCGPLGGRVGVAQGHKFLGDFAETDEALEFVREHMDNEQFWPTVWWVSDHGNEWPIDPTTGEEIKDTAD